MLRRSSPIFGDVKCVSFTGKTLGDYIYDHPKKRDIQKLLRQNRVCQKVTEIITVHSAERNKFTLFVLPSSYLISITPTREVIVKNRIVKNYKGYFPNKFKLPPCRTIVVAYRVSEVAKQRLIVAGEEKGLKLFKVDMSHRQPKILDFTSVLK